MGNPAFLPGQPVNLRFSRSTITPNRTRLTTQTQKPRRRPQTPQCGLSKNIAAATAAAAAISISCLPLRPRVSEAASHTTAHPNPTMLVVNATTRESKPHSLAVVGVGKAAIHDYSSPRAEAHVQTPYMRREAPLYAESHSLDHVDDARREFVLASRLVTAVLLGVMLGVERRATRLNLGVRSVTLISLTSSMVWVMATAGESAGLFAPVLVGGPCVAVGGAGIVAGLCTYAATKVRRRSTRNAGGMSALVGLCLAMGGACGAGLSLLTVGCYLAAVGVLRGDQGRNLNSVQVRDSAGGGERSVRKAGCEIGRPMMDRVGNVMGESVDGSGSST